jgi:hypothetical protein
MYPRITYAYLYSTLDNDRAYFYRESATQEEKKINKIIYHIHAIPKSGKCLSICSWCLDSAMIMQYKKM